MSAFCECESNNCHGEHDCLNIEASPLRQYNVAGYKQILCESCARKAQQYAEDGGYEFASTGESVLSEHEQPEVF